MIERTSRGGDRSPRAGPRPGRTLGPRSSRNTGRLANASVKAAAGPSSEPDVAATSIVQPGHSSWDGAVGPGAAGTDPPSQWDPTSAWVVADADAAWHTQAQTSPEARSPKVTIAARMLRAMHFLGPQARRRHHRWLASRDFTSRQRSLSRSARCIGLLSVWRKQTPGGRHPHQPRRAKGLIT